MSSLHSLASELGVSDRTLRRAVASGLIKGERTSPYKLHISMRERSYVRRHWPAIAAIRAVLRTRHRVRLAVLFGSAARGDDLPTSDIDLLIESVEGSPGAVADLSMALRKATGREIQIVSPKEVEGSQQVRADVAADGRVLVDRDQVWGDLRDRWSHG